MTYPTTLGQSNDSTQQTLAGRQLDRATNGMPRIRQFFPAAKKTFRVVHPALTPAEKATFDAFYAANQLSVFDFVWEPDGQTYSCMFAAEDPVYALIPGGRWTITVGLVEA